jgi:hypothetical protein
MAAMTKYRKFSKKSIDIILKGDHPRTISAKSGQNWPMVSEED